jgi:hypothetical protein
MIMSVGGVCVCFLLFMPDVFLLIRLAGAEKGKKGEKKGICGLPPRFLFCPSDGCEAVVGDGVVMCSPPPPAVCSMMRRTAHRGAHPGQSIGRRRRTCIRPRLSRRCGVGGGPAQRLRLPRSSTCRGSHRVSLMSSAHTTPDPAGGYIIVSHHECHGQAETSSSQTSANPGYWIVN